MNTKERENHNRTRAKMGDNNDPDHADEETKAKHQEDDGKGKNYNENKNERKRSSQAKAKQDATGQDGNRRGHGNDGGQNASNGTYTRWRAGTTPEGSSRSTRPRRAPQPNQTTQTRRPGPSTGRTMGRARAETTTPQATTTGATTSWSIPDRGRPPTTTTAQQCRAQVQGVPQHTVMM